MPTAITHLSTQTVTSAVTSVSFSSISASYRDLYITFSATIDSASAQIVRVIFNNDTGITMNCSFVESSNTTKYQAQIGASRLFMQYNWSPLKNSVYTYGQLNILDYAKTDRFKTILGQTGNGTLTMGYAAGRANIASAIHTVTIETSSNNFVNSSFSLFGVSA